MKNAIILHGTGDTNANFWFPWIKERLEEKDFTVWLPQLPNAGKPNLKDWIPFILGSGLFTEETVLIGHSAGAQIILSILEKINVKIKQAILVSGYAESLRIDDQAVEKPALDWEKMKEHFQEIVFINSDNDPWKCDDVQGRLMFDNLGGTLIIRRGEGHMGSTTYNQPYKEFPLLLRLVS